MIFTLGLCSACVTFRSENKSSNLDYFIIGISVFEIIFEFNSSFRFQQTLKRNSILCSVLLFGLKINKVQFLTCWDLIGSVLAFEIIFVFHSNKFGNFFTSNHICTFLFRYYLAKLFLRSFVIY